MKLVAKERRVHFSCIFLIEISCIISVMWFKITFKIMIIKVNRFIYNINILHIHSMFKLRGPKKREKRRPNFRDKVASKLNKKK